MIHLGGIRDRGMVARLRAKNAARMMYVIGTLNLSSGEMSVTDT